MGIRFFCPNGHRLNVKSYLAGKKGICPQCGVKLRIPVTSDPRAKRGAKVPDEHQQVAVSDDEVSSFITGQEVATAPVAKEESGRAAWSDVDIDARADERSSVPPAAAPPPLPDVDPIAKAGDAVWYVRHADGSQYGPAEPTILRRWLDEGRIGPDSMVWHQGAPDWKIAGEVFPTLSKTLGDPSTAPRQGMEPPAQSVADNDETSDVEGAVDSTKGESPEIDSNDPGVALARQRRLRKRRSVMLLITLIVTAVLLGAVALFVVFR